MLFRSFADVTTVMLLLHFFTFDPRWLNKQVPQEARGGARTKRYGAVEGGKKEVPWPMPVEI